MNSHRANALQLKPAKTGLVLEGDDDFIRRSTPRGPDASFKSCSLNLASAAISIFAEIIAKPLSDHVKSRRFIRH